LRHLDFHCRERKKKNKEPEGPEIAATTTMEDFASMYDMVFSFITLVSSVSGRGFRGDNRWIVDSGASFHMTGIWGVFLNITETGPDGQVVNEGGMSRAIHGVGRVIFQLKYGGFLEFDGVSALEDVGYCTLFKREHVFIYREGVDPVELQLISDQVNMLYML
jgi:hypothetical protein